MIGNRLLLLALPFLVLASACSEDIQSRETPAGTTATIVPASRIDQLALLPPQTNVVFHANLAALRQTPAGEDLRMELERKIRDEHDEDYMEFAKKTGVDINKDVDVILVAAMPGEHDASIGGALAVGKFDERRIVDYMRTKQGAQFEKKSYRGHDVYSGDGHEELITFLNSGTVLLGVQTWVEAIIDQFEDKKPGILQNPVMAGHIQDLSAKSHLWGIANLDEMSQKWADELRRSGSGFSGTKSLENMRSLLFYTVVDQEADVFVRGNFRTSEEAETLAEAITGFKALGKLMLADDPEAMEMLNEIKIRSDGPVVEISTHVNSEFIDKVKEKRRKFSGGGKLM